jgi:hypothetical protein
MPATSTRQSTVVVDNLQAGVDRMIFKMTGLDREEIE